MPTVSGTVTDASGNATSWSASWTVGGNPARDLVAIAAFPSYASATYGDHAAVIAKMVALGVKNVRHLLTPTMSAAVRTFVTNCNAAGIKTWLTVGTPRDPFTTAQWNTVEALLKGELRGKVTRVFSWNEPNNQRSSNDPPLTNWDGLTVTECQKLWAMIQRVNADYLTDGTPKILVGTPGLWSGDPAKQFTDLGKIAAGIAGTYDFIAWHLYMRPVNGGFDVSWLTNQETQFRNILNDSTRPIVCTEAGYFTAPNYSGSSNPVTEAQQASLIPQLINWYVSRGYGLCYFELLDDVDPSGSERESSFGVVRTPSNNSSTWTNKPAFAAMASSLA